MSKTSTALLLSTLSLALILTFGCKADTTGLSTLTVLELSGLLEDGAQVLMYDANSQKTRDKYGIIPGAILLSHYSDYDAAKELPPTKSQKLVFYCAGQLCSSAPTAARKALEVGYTDVHVLPAGIKGWVEAEKPVERPAPSEQS
jgi:rhodanese-related sulfurtransferase